MPEYEAQIKQNAKEIGRLDHKFDQLDKQFAVAFAELNKTLESMSDNIKHIRGTMEAYIQEAKKDFATKASLGVIEERLNSFATKEEMKTQKTALQSMIGRLKSDGVYAKLWNGVIGAAVATILGAVLLFILGMQNL